MSPEANPALLKKNTKSLNYPRKGRLKITIKNLQKKFHVVPKEVKKTILKTLFFERIKKTGEITVCFTGDRLIKELNKKFLRKNEATDCLIFDMLEASDPKHIFADIIISTDTALRNAKAFRTDVSKEINLYLIHGILHLLGYDDLTPKDKKLMRDKEKEYVN